jgi:glycolate oxidase subunit GlcD
MGNFSSTAINEKIYKDIKKIVNEENIAYADEDLFVYSYDAYSDPFLDEEITSSRAYVVVRVENKEQISKIIKYANENRIPVIPRGAGSGMSGGVVPIKGGIVIDLKPMNKITDLRIEDLQVTVQPGVVKAKLDAFLKPYGFFFPPDPASEDFATIGGMIANNAGGLKAVKYGVTRDYVLSLEVVLPNGKIIKTGAKTLKYSIGYDLTRLFVGSEGTLGVITEATLKIVPLPQYRAIILVQYDSMETAMRAVIAIMKSGIVPTSLEFLDEYTLQGINLWKRTGLPEKPTLFVELDGTKEEVSSKMEIVIKTCKVYNPITLEWSDEPAMVEKMWSIRKSVGVIMRLKKEWTKLYGAEDIVVPLSKIPIVVKKYQEIGKKYGVHISCIGHAGDGNIHASLHYDMRDKERMFPIIKKKIFDEIHRLAIEVGGAIAGEHGIGLARKRWMIEQHGEGIEVMRAIKKVLDPNNIMNPGKIF